MHIVKKSCFTLLELLIVLFIISFGIILTGIKIKEVYQEQRFLSEAQQILSHLSMAQDLMLIMDTDVWVKLTPDQKTGVLNVWLEMEKPIEDPSWGRLIGRKLSLIAIQSLEFDGASVRDLTLQFSFGRMSKGTLVLLEGEQDKKHHVENRKFQIELLGYPCPLGAKNKILKEEEKSGRSEQLYPVEVYEKLYEDSNEKNSETP